MAENLEYEIPLIPIVHLSYPIGRKKRFFCEYADDTPIMAPDVLQLQLQTFTRNNYSDKPIEEELEIKSANVTYALRHVTRK